MAILVTGGAGYIGSHAVKALTQRGEDVVVYDNLSTGFAQAVADPLLEVGDLMETERLTQLIRQRDIQAVIHFAAKSRVAESMSDPALYYHNNVSGTLSLLTAMRDAGVSILVFSSTAAVYGNAQTMPITEEAPLHPESVYGRSKLMIEDMMRDFDAAHGIRSIALRYFNVAGADPSGDIGEAHTPETHLIPNILRHLLGMTDTFELYGDDYPTRDGTCVRDYIEIGDLISAHLLALDALRDGRPTDCFNLGSGNGYTNKEILDAAEGVTGRKANVRQMPRRPGDPATLIASSQRIKKELGWNPQNENLEAILRSAWKWHSGHPNGYEE